MRSRITRTSELDYYNYGKKHGLRALELLIEYMESRNMWDRRLRGAIAEKDLLISDLKKKSNKKES